MNRVPVSMTETLEFISQTKREVCAYNLSSQELETG